MTAIQEELRRFAHAQPKEVSDHFYNAYGIIVQRHLDGKLLLCDYDQLAAHKHRATEIVMESRGIILCSETLDIIRRPFARFFNIGEAPAYEADIDYTRLEGLEKADGSLVTLYFNRITRHWHFGTRGTPFADAQHRLGGVLYDRIIRAAGLACSPGTAEFDKQMRLLDPKVTYLFEFVGPDNRHVTPYARSELVLLGARRTTGEEFNPEEVHWLLNEFLQLGWNVRAPRRYPISLELKGMSRDAQIQAIKHWIATAPDFKGFHEGVVCFDPQTGKRLKVKTPLYCATHLQGPHYNEGATDTLNISNSRVADLIVSGDAAEFCLYFPHLADKIGKMAAKVQAFVDDMAPTWELIKGIENQKEFALKVQEHSQSAGSALYFQAKKLGESPAAAWQQMPLPRKSALVERLIS